MQKPRNLRRTVTLKEVAAHCDVHFMTVSRALRRDPRVRLETAAHILAVAAELGYDPADGHAARRLASRARGTRVPNYVIGLFFPPNFVRSSYFADMFQGIVEELTPAGYSLHIIPTYDPEHPDRMLTQLPPVLRRGEIDGAIITEWPRHVLPMLQQLRDEPHFGDRPIVSLMVEHPGCDAVLTDDFSGMSAAMNHLLDLGHTHFLHGYWQDDTHYTARQRLQAMQQACVNRGLPPGEHLFFYGLDWESPLSRRMARPLQAAWREHPEITAILAPNDQYAVQAAGILQEMGRSVPRDISLVGFDDVVPLPDRAGVNQLSTIRLPLEDVGREAARCILQRLASPQMTVPGHLLPAIFVPRATTAPPPAGRR